MQQMIVFNACIGGMLLHIKLFHAGTSFCKQLYAVLAKHLHGS